MINHKSAQICLITFLLIINVICNHVKDRLRLYYENRAIELSKILKMEVP